MTKCKSCEHLRALADHWKRATERLMGEAQKADYHVRKAMEGATASAQTSMDAQRFISYAEKAYARAVAMMNEEGMKEAQNRDMDTLVKRFGESWKLDAVRCTFHKMRAVLEAVGSEGCDCYGERGRKYECSQCRARELLDSIQKEGISP